MADTQKSQDMEPNDSEKPKEAIENADTTDDSMNKDDERPKDRFRVRQVNFNTEPDTESKEPATVEDLNETATESPEQPESPHRENFTQGYATNEAIPMTIFYRNRDSYNQPSRQRPTLQELRRGLENDSPLQVSFSLCFASYI